MLNASWPETICSTGDRKAWNLLLLMLYWTNWLNIILFSQTLYFNKWYLMVCFHATQTFTSPLSSSLLNAFLIENFPVGLLIRVHSTLGSLLVLSEHLHHLHSSSSHSPLWPLSVWTTQLKVAEVWERQEKARVVWGTSGWGGWSSRVAWGCGASSNRAVSRGSPHSRCWPVVWWKLHVCWSLSAGGTPRGGWGGQGDGGEQAGECVSLSRHPPQRRPD